MGFFERSSTHFEPHKRDFIKFIDSLGNFLNHLLVIGLHTTQIFI
jgi:hypothetical protein